jgi:hypothetical protein
MARGLPHFEEKDLLRQLPWSSRKKRRQETVPSSHARIFSKAGLMSLSF